MIIDFHTHSFPDDIADRAVGRLAQSGGIPNYLDGRVDLSLIHISEPTRPY